MNLTAARAEMKVYSSIMQSDKGSPCSTRASLSLCEMDHALRFFCFEWSSEDVISFISDTKH